MYYLSFIIHHAKIRFGNTKRTYVSSAYGQNIIHSIQCNLFVKPSIFELEEHYMKIIIYSFAYLAFRQSMIGWNAYGENPANKFH